MFLNAVLSIQRILKNPKILSNTNNFFIVNNKKCFWAPNQHIAMISEGSCDTEDYVCWKFSFAITGIIYIFHFKNRIQLI